MADIRRRTDPRAGYPPRWLTAVVLAIGAVALGIAAVAAIGDTAARAAASTSPVTATVVGERTEDRLVADRRGTRYVPFRFVVVELPDGTSAEVRSDELVVGADATVHRTDSGTVSETPPEPPGPLEWAVCATAVGGAVVLAAGSLRVLSRPRRPGSGPS
ncbi:hypothetical protein [Agromyces kandeliae]|uniref:Uncharacterized protein n=1 Tax=Agromyces kandeliae TaxID=2666141 RepID=A0A6L5QZ93_9MICO|nr:hypothetical protein [Agromyces kandeliae]MRX42674.1 hypothetical protein [Agromyces kandeliae]